MRLSRKKTFKKKRRNKAMKGGSMAGAFFQFLADVYSEDKQKKGRSYTPKFFFQFAHGGKHVKSSSSA